MFDRIPLLRIAQAYSLLYSECLELAKELTAYLRIGDGYLLADKIDEIADYWTEGRPQITNLQEHDIALWISYGVLTSINEKLMKSGELEKRRMAMKCLILGAMTVDKREAIHFLHKNGYTPKKDVKGIGKDFVFAVTKEKNIIDVHAIENVLKALFEKLAFPQISLQEKATPLYSTCSALPQHSHRAEQPPARIFSEIPREGNKRAAPEGMVKEFQNDGLPAEEIARRLDEVFTNPKISNADLGKLLPANPGTLVSIEAARSRGKRLRGKK